MDRPPIDRIEQQVAAIDPSPWRAMLDRGELVIWFHAQLAREPRRIIVCLDDEPSPNELAAAEFLVNSREYVRDLSAYVLELEAQLQEAVREHARLLNAYGSPAEIDAMMQAGLESLRSQLRPPPLHGEGEDRLF